MITKDSKNIVVADDSVFFRTKLSDILVEAGHRVRFAKDGREVINEIKINSTGIDLLILDLQMPDVDGFGVLKWMEDNGLKGRFPVLVVTGVYDPSHVMESLRNMGAAGLMTKGSTPEQIIFRVNRVLFPDKASKGVNLYERVPVSVPADFTIGEASSTGFLLNISEGGTFLHTKMDIPAGAVLHLRFTLPGTKTFDLKGTVRWSTTEVAKKTLFGGYGIMFESPAEDDLKALREFIDDEKKRLGFGQE